MKSECVSVAGSCRNEVVDGDVVAVSEIVGLGFALSLVFVESGFLDCLVCFRFYCGQLNSVSRERAFDRNNDQFRPKGLLVEIRFTSVHRLVWLEFG